MSAKAGGAVSIARRSRHDTSVRKRGRLPRDRYRAGWGHLSPAETVQVPRIASQILGQSLHSAGKVAYEVIARNRTGRRTLPQCLFQTLPHQPGFRDPPRPGLAAEILKQIIRQSHGNRLHNRSVIRVVLQRNTGHPPTLGSGEGKPLWRARRRLAGDR